MICCGSRPGFLTTWSRNTGSMKPFWLKHPSEIYNQTLSFKYCVSYQRFLSMKTSEAFSYEFNSASVLAWINYTVQRETYRCLYQEEMLRMKIDFLSVAQCRLWFQNHFFSFTCPSVQLPLSISLCSQNAQRLGGSQVAQPLTTPVVSVATPSLLAPFSGMQTAYNTGELWKAAKLGSLVV